jgi:hypothetical protein
MLTYADVSGQPLTVCLLVDDIDYKSSVVVESFCDPYQTCADVC